MKMNETSRYFDHITGFLDNVKCIECKEDGTTWFIHKYGRSSPTRSEFYTLKYCLENVKSGNFKEIKIKIKRKIFDLSKIDYILLRVWFIWLLGITTGAAMENMRKIDISNLKLIMLSGCSWAIVMLIVKKYKKD